MKQLTVLYTAPSQCTGGLRGKASTLSSGSSLWLADGLDDSVPGNWQRRVGVSRTYARAMLKPRLRTIPCLLIAPVISEIRRRFCGKDSIPRLFAKSVDTAILEAKGSSHSSVSR